MDPTRLKKNLERYLNEYIKLLSGYEDNGVTKRSYSRQDQPIYGVVLDLNLIIKTETIPIPIELPASGTKEATIDVQGLNAFMKERLSILQTMDPVDHSQIEGFVKAFTDEIRSRFGAIPSQKR